MRTGVTDTILQHVSPPYQPFLPFQPLDWPFSVRSTHFCRLDKANENLRSHRYLLWLIINHCREVFCTTIERHQSPLAETNHGPVVIEYKLVLSKSFAEVEAEEGVNVTDLKVMYLCDVVGDEGRKNPQAPSSHIEYVALIIAVQAIYSYLSACLCQSGLLWERAGTKFINVELKFVRRFDNEVVDLVAELLWKAKEMAFGIFCCSSFRVFTERELRIHSCGKTDLREVMLTLAASEMLVDSSTPTEELERPQRY